jgi:SWI/SNF-related matrix-associated actin-dependent regulator 1 of chromatin subfamily A
MALVDRFQSDPDCAAFIGQIDAAGVGLTLTAASHVIFVEYDWRPGVLEQASDRAHRIGQKDSVTCSYLVIEDSLDDVMLSSINKKRDTLHETLDLPCR